VHACLPGRRASPDAVYRDRRRAFLHGSRVAEHGSRPSLQSPSPASGRVSGRISPPNPKGDTPAYQNRRSLPCRAFCCYCEQELFPRLKARGEETRALG